jgi:hypothetical protein
MRTDSSTRQKKQHRAQSISSERKAISFSSANCIVLSARYTNPRARQRKRFPISRRPSKSQPPSTGTMKLFWIHYSLAQLFRDEEIRGRTCPHRTRQAAHGQQSVLPCSCVELQASIWYKQRRLEDARSEALRAADSTPHVHKTPWINGAFENQWKATGRALGMCKTEGRSVTLTRRSRHCPLR